MRKSLWVMLSVLLLGIATNARADSFTATFTCTGTCGSLPAITNNPVTFPSPVLDFSVFDSPPLTFTLDAGDAPTDTINWDLEVVSGIATFVFSDVTSGDNGHRVFSSSVAANEGGSLTFAAVTTTEPSSAGLLMLGIGLVFLARKRIGPALSRAV